MSTRRYPILVSWFDDEDEYFDVEAATFDDACRVAYAQWATTGWTGLAVYDLDSPAFMSFNLRLPFDEGNYHE